MGNLFARDTRASDRVAKPSRPPLRPVPSGPPMTIVAQMLQGNTFELEAPSDSLVRDLKEQLVPMLPGGPHAYQLKLIIGEDVEQLPDAQMIRDTALTSGSPLTVIIGPAIPPWAVELGFSPDHPNWLREHFAKHELSVDWCVDDDVTVWQKLKETYDALEGSKSMHKHWQSRVHLIDGDGRKAGQVFASPGSQVSLKLQGEVWNKNRDTCIQQCGLALGPLEGGDGVLGELYNGVPRSGASISKTVQVTAPNERGAYLLYTFTDLQYSFADARRNFRNNNTKVSVKYPNEFVGWLVVE